MEKRDINESNDEKKPSFWQIVFSTLAAFLGVQSNKNRERDFKYGNIYVYIVSGLIFTIMFIFTVVSVVKLVILNAGM
jgi:pilus assembly protein TadC